MLFLSLANTARLWEVYNLDMAANARFEAIAHLWRGTALANAAARGGPLLRHLNLRNRVVDVVGRLAPQGQQQQSAPLTPGLAVPPPAVSKRTAIVAMLALLASAWTLHRATSANIPCPAMLNATLVQHIATCERSRSVLVLSLIHI